MLLLLLLQRWGAVLQAVQRQGVRGVHHLRQARHQVPRGAQEEARRGGDAEPPVHRRGLHRQVGSTHSYSAGQVSSFTRR